MAKTSGVNPKVVASKKPTPSKTSGVNPKQPNPIMKKGGKKMC